MALADPQRIEALDPFDPLQLADQLSEEERMIQGAARAYAEPMLPFDPDDIEPDTLSSDDIAPIAPPR